MCSILLHLFSISREWMEKFYFGFCAASAASGLLRTVAGDRAFHAALYIRVIMLSSAILVGFMIVRTNSQRDAGYAETGWNDFLPSAIKTQISFDNV